LAASAVGLLAGSGGSSVPARQGAVAQGAGRGPCGYSASGVGSLPAEAKEVLPGHPVLLSTEALIDGGFRDLALIEIKFKPAFAAVQKRALAHGWKMNGSEVEVVDAEMLLRRDQEWMNVALKQVTGCAGTQVEVIYTPQS
jgi:hypothetical protein